MMTGRVWAGVLGAIIAGVLSAAGVVLGPCYGLAGFAASVGFAWVAGIVITQVDEQTLEDPEEHALAAGQTAGLITGIGGAAGQIIAALAVAALAAEAPDAAFTRLFTLALGLCLGLGGAVLSLFAGGIGARTALRRQWFDPTRKYKQR